LSRKTGEAARQQFEQEQSLSATAPPNSFRPTRRRREVSHMELRDWYELVRIQLRREEGQTMTEYGILLALIVVGVIAVLVLLGPKIVSAFSNVNAHL
jgi:pilus assembly protein Flp/PilA